MTRAFLTAVTARWWRIVVATGAVFIVYQALIGAILSAGLGGPPSYVRLHAAWGNVRRIVEVTPSARDVVTLVAREPIVEYGRTHPSFGAAVWSYEITWASLLFFLSFSLLVGIYLGLDTVPRGWGALGSVGGAGMVGMLGASVSSLTHCGLGSFGVLLALAGVSTATIAWFGVVEPVLIPAGYGLMVVAIIARVARLTPRASATTLTEVDVRGAA
jgi:hypothetical protein